MLYQGVSKTCYGEDIGFEEKRDDPSKTGPMKYQYGNCSENGYGTQFEWCSSKKGAYKCNIKEDERKFTEISGSPPVQMEIIDNKKFCGKSLPGKPSVSDLKSIKTR